ncbi:hypothetical protein Purlil1_13103 [Purpureocillium lilacinum]|uniref:Uncharacterized protein n=1 Tax=Purpureocillium lilacinum TaxID=33203 RepID=A0ABR0BF76_PURLI|nr:hypothetical protein Purlil1_13103 [Purpureocillium lilacinum]
MDVSAAHGHEPFPFARLPLEVRHLVYELLVPRGTPFLLGASTTASRERFSHVPPASQRKAGTSTLSCLGRACRSLSREECHSVLYRNTTFYASNLDTLLLFWERRSRSLARHNSIVHLSHYDFTTQDMTELHRLTMSMNPCCLHFCGMGGLWEQALKGDIEMKQPPTCLQWLSSISRLLERTTAFELRVGLDAIAVDDPLRPWEELANGKMAEECTPHRCLRACDLFPLHGCRHERAAETGAEPGVREDNHLSDWEWHYDMYGERALRPSVPVDLLSDSEIVQRLPVEDLTC